MKTTYDGHGRSNYHYQKIYLQVRVRSGSANEFSMSSIIVCDSNGKNWIIEGDPFHDWAKYKTPWFKLEHWQPIALSPIVAGHWAMYLEHLKKLCVRSK